MKKKELLVVGSAFVMLWAVFTWVKSTPLPGKVSPFLVEVAESATSSQVTVSATVNVTVSCATDNSSTSFGTLDTASISTSTPNASTTITCGNAALGCSLYVKDANAGLATTTPAYTIPSATAALSAGTEGYGIQATSTAAGSGGTLGLSATYGGSKFNTNNVGALSTGDVLLASSTAAVTGREVVVKHKAAISTVTQSGSYTDTITYSCTGN